MRYVIQTNDDEGLIGIQISKWEKEMKLSVIEKSETLVELQNSLDKVISALNNLKKVGYNSEVMEIFLKEKTKLSMRDIRTVLSNQELFLKQIGALKR